MGIGSAEKWGHLKQIGRSSLASEWPVASETRFSRQFDIRQGCRELPGVHVSQAAGHEWRETEGWSFSLMPESAQAWNRRGASISGLGGLSSAPPIGIRDCAADGEAHGNASLSANSLWSDLFRRLLELKLRVQRQNR